MRPTYLLEVVNVSKAYSSVKALNDVSLRIRPGTVHTVMGENGAGKSTLMKIIAGIVQPDSGEMILNGEKVKFANPRDALRHGISMIHQELTPIPEMTIAENIFLGREPVKLGNMMIDYKRMNREVERLLNEMSIKLDPRMKMKNLTVSETQMIEIAKAMFTDPKLIIMDEPTSAITSREVETLFVLIEMLKSKGCSIMYISHKMDEVFRISDEITIMRDGNYVGSYLASELNYELLIKKMVDRELKDVFPARKAQIASVALSVKNLSHGKRFRDVSFEIRAGEVVGFAGLMGSGRTEVAESIFGIRKLDNGEIYIAGNKVRIRAPHDAIQHKIGLITEDRKLQGLVLPLSVKENITLSSLKHFKKRSGIINKKHENAVVSDYIDMLKIKTPHADQSVETLSGGNQQKVVIGKWLMKSPKIMIFDEPTRGIDIGAKSEIYRKISSLAEEGIAIILISSELPEILGMSDRILVFHDGTITGEFTREDATQENIMKYATGTHNQEATV